MDKRLAYWLFMTCGIGYTNHRHQFIIIVINTLFLKKIIITRNYMYLYQLQ